MQIPLESIITFASPLISLVAAITTVKLGIKDHERRITKLENMKLGEELATINAYIKAINKTLDEMKKTMENIQKQQMEIISSRNK